MNVASLDLCRELYELSGWDDTSYEYYHAEYPNRMDVVAVRAHDTDVLSICPAYDLGYLLDKLPMFIEIKHPTTLRLTIGTVIGGRWCASYDSEVGDFEFEEFADSPTDAAAKLAIELFKQGVLQK